MTSLEKQALYSVLLRLTDDNQILTPMERRDIINQIVHAACGMTADDILSSTQNNRKLQIKRGTKSQNDNYTGLPGEITFDETDNSLRIHDGTTVGGHLIGGGSFGNMFANANLSNITDSACNIIANARRLDFDNRIDYTAASQITIPSDGYIFCRGSTRSMDWVTDDFQTVIMAEFILSNNYSTVWAPVFIGQCLKNRVTSEYQQVCFIPYISIN